MTGANGEQPELALGEGGAAGSLCGAGLRWRVLLASRSPRRQAMLREAGVRFVAAHPGFEDAGLRPGNVDPRRWTASLAYLKALTALRRGAFGDVLPGADDVVVGADTAIVKGDRLIGTPESEEEAKEILRALRNGTHTVVSGLAMIHPAGGRREMTWDEADVRVGELSDERIEAYVGCGAWRGKAGGYNLRERMDDGWPISYGGEASTIMGLPMPKLLERLEAWQRSSRMAG
ncbi:MAG: Maf family protein [Phycisphaeraceae bacterium]|nr:Maf family protein [Phycisphaeraceae bacterium]